MNVDDKQRHSLTCSWTPYSSGTGKPAKLILVSCQDFTDAMKDISEQFKSTQSAVSKTNSLCIELVAKMDEILRNGVS